MIAKAFVADDADNEIHWGSHIKSTDAGSTGVYRLIVDVTIKPGNANDTVEMSAYQNAVYLTKLESQTKLGATTDYQSFAANCLISYTVGDVIAVSAMNVSSGSDVTIRNANVTIARIG